VLSAVGQPEEGPEVDKLLSEVRKNASGQYTDFDPDCILRYLLQPGMEPRDLEGLDVFSKAMQACDAFIEDRVVVRVRPRGVGNRSPLPASLSPPSSAGRGTGRQKLNRRGSLDGELGLFGGPLGALRTARALVLGATSGIVGALFIKPFRTPGKGRRRRGRWPHVDLCM